MLVEDLNLKNYLIPQYKKLNGKRLFGRTMPCCRKKQMKI